MIDLSESVAELFAECQSGRDDARCAMVHRAADGLEHRRWVRVLHAQRGQCCDCNRALPTATQERLPGVTPATRTGRRCPACEKRNRVRVAAWEARHRARGRATGQMTLRLMAGLGA